MRRFFLPAVLLAAFAVTPQWADEGRIPIFSKIIITQSGHYVLTRDFTYSSGDGIDIGVNNVTLDLNGHTITGPSTGNVVVIHTGSATPIQGIVIRNGRLLNGAIGINSSPSNRVSIRIEDVEIAGFAVHGIAIQAAESVTVARCLVHSPSSGGNGIEAFGGTGPFQGHFVDNTVRHVGGDGMRFDGLRAGEVRGNMIEDYGLAGARYGIEFVTVSGDGGNLVEGNTIHSNSSDDDGIRTQNGSSAILILKNVVSGTGRYGIYSQGDRTRIRGNLVTDFYSGIVIQDGSLNYLEENQVQGSTNYGIFFYNDLNHVFRNNTLLNNATAVGYQMPPPHPNILDAGGNISLP